MFSIKVTLKNQRYFLGKAGKPNIYKTRPAAEKVATKLNKKYYAQVCTALPVAEL